METTKYLLLGIIASLVVCVHTLADTNLNQGVDGQRLLSIWQSMSQDVVTARLKAKLVLLYHAEPKNAATRDQLVSLAERLADLVDSSASDIKFDNAISSFLRSGNWPQQSWRIITITHDPESTRNDFVEYDKKRAKHVTTRVRTVDGEVRLSLTPANRGAEVLAGRSSVKLYTLRDIRFIPPFRETKKENPFQLVDHGFAGMAQGMQILFNEAMKLERTETLEAQPYERTPLRRGYANGYKPKTVQTRVGPLELAVPQTRGVEFYPSALERGQRSERALALAVAEMYVQGVSTRKVSAVMQELCGTDITSVQVSRAAAALDEELSQWRDRPLGEIAYLQLDARYEKVRLGGTVVSCALLLAVGITSEGRRTILGVSVSLSEAEVHWREFLGSLQQRGLHGVRLITSDDHAGLKQALAARLPGVPWQRCQFHLAKNLLDHLPKHLSQSEASAELRAVFQATDRSEAERLLDQMVRKYASSAPKLSAWLETAVPEGLTVLDFPLEHRRRLRTNNGLERLNREIKRRTRVATLFPNEASLLRLATAVLMETDDEWQTEKRYLPMKPA